MPFSCSVLWQVADSLCLKIKFKWDNSQKRCPLSGTGLTDPTLQQQDQTLPMCHLVPGAFSAKNIGPCIHRRGNIAGTTSAGSTSAAFASQEKHQQSKREHSVDAGL